MSTKMLKRFIEGVGSYMEAASLAEMRMDVAKNELFGKKEPIVKDTPTCDESDDEMVMLPEGLIVKAKI